MKKQNYRIVPRRILPVIIALLAALAAPLLHAQIPAPVPVEISKQKIASEGKVYYMHHVMRGQTLYSISKAYNVTVDQITRENDIQDNGIREGQMLRIPGNGGSQASSPQTAVKTKEQTAAQTVNTRSGVPPGSETMPRTAPASQDDRFIYHKVKKGETLYSIAGEYGISVRDLKKANKGLLFPGEGDFLLIPRKKMTGQREETVTPPEEKPVLVDAAVNDSAGLQEVPEQFTVPGNRTEINRLNGSIRVALLLPFFINENNAISYTDSARRDSQGNRIFREVTKSGGIYEGSIPFIETYEGILIAVDSMRTLGLSVELDVFDIGADSVQVNRLLWSGALNNANLIIGPVFSYNLEKVSTWAAGRNIPIVSPVALRDRNILENKPTLYRVFPSENAAQALMAGVLRNHRGSNVLFLYADSAMQDPVSALLWARVRNVMAEAGQDDTTSLTPFYFTGLAQRRNAYSSVTSIDNLLDPDRENIIIVASTNSSIVSSAFSNLHGLTRKYNIKVIGYPEIGGFETVDLIYFYDLELYIPSSSYIDFNSVPAREFTARFMQKFRTEPMAESFAWRGFDIAWYFIGGLAVGGEGFLKDPGTFNPQLLSLEPDFRRESRQNGFENMGMFMLHYRKDMTIEVIRPWSAPVPQSTDTLPAVSYPFPGSSARNRER
ncbi:MAG: LysM peptidoglycan-binding domain-containing protein [Bacteroidales bacterium]